MAITVKEVVHEVKQIVQKAEDEKVPVSDSGGSSLVENVKAVASANNLSTEQIKAHKSLFD